MTVPPIRTSRRERWSATVVNPDGSQTGLDLDADQPGRFTWRAKDQSPFGGRLECIGRPPELRHGQLVRVTYEANGERWRLPMLVPAIDEPVYDVGHWFGLDLIDQTIVLDGDGIDFPVVYDAGTPIMATVRNIITASSPAIPVSLPAVDHTLRNPSEWPVSAAPLAMVNQLLETGGATHLAPAAESDGLQSTMWISPRDRPVRMRFGPAALDAGYLPQVRVRDDYLATPNVVHYTTSGSAAADRIVGRWRDEDPNSPWGIPRRQRRIVEPAQGEAATQEIADGHARRIGLERRGRVATIRGGWQPLFPGHVTETSHPNYPELSARWEVQEMSWTTALGSETTWTLLEVT